MQDKQFAIKDIVNISISMLSLVVATVALYISYQTQQASMENLGIIIRKAEESTFNFSKPANFPFHTVNTKWTADLTNLSTINNSIVGIRVWVFNERHSKQSWSGLTRGIFDANEKELVLPFQVEPGNTKRLVVAVKTAVAEKVVPIIEKYIETCQNNSLSSLIMYLARHNTDLFGNDVEYLGEKNGDMCSTQEGLSIGTSIQRNWGLEVELETARGSTFIGEESWYHSTAGY